METKDKKKEELDMYDLEVIKNKFGEKMAHLCRELFSTILEYPGALSKLLTDHFEPQKFLAEDIENQKLKYEFKDYIYKIFDEKYREEEPSQEERRSPQELLDQAGYILYECQTEEDIQAFKKYYALGEELCTFRGGRLDDCHVFFAVKKDVDKIKRKNFPSPERQDEYGTSVISIQFTRDSSHTLSIKNRYNHTVINPDATFSNNLENIIPGLTKSFENTYGLRSKQKSYNFEIRGYVRANDGKYYKYNFERNNIYYCPDNIIIDNFEVKRYPKERYIVLDCFVLDMNEKKLFLYDQELHDCFPDTIGNIKKAGVLKNRKEGTKRVIFTVTDGESVSIELDRQNQIIGYHNPNLLQVGDNFLKENVCLQALSLPEVTKIGDYFLPANKKLQHIDLPKVQIIGNYFVICRGDLKKVILPELREVGAAFLIYNEDLQELNLPKLQKTSNYFLGFNAHLQQLNLPELRKVSRGFLELNKALSELNLPELMEAGDYFFAYNDSLLRVNLPKLQKVGTNFLYENQALQKLSFPELREAGDDFLPNNVSLREIDLPKLKKAGKKFLSSLPDFPIIQYYPLENGGIVFSRADNNVPYSRQSEEEQSSFYRK